MTQSSVSKKRPVSEEEVDSDGSWAISYGDMITLLLAFFILFFSIDHKEDRKKQLDQSLLVALSELQSAPPSDRTPAQALLAGKVEQPNIPIGKKLKEKHPDEEVLKDFGARVIKTGNKILVDFPDRSFFDFGKIEVNSSGERTLFSFAKKYLPFSGNYYLGIRAYTDDTPVSRRRGRRFEDNLELSALRSVSTMRVLQKAGIPLNRMKLGGYGELKLTADQMQQALEKEQTQTEGSPLARRVILVIEAELREEA